MFRIGKSYVILLTRWWTLRFHKQKGLVDSIYNSCFQNSDWIPWNKFRAKRSRPFWWNPPVKSTVVLEPGSSWWEVHLITCVFFLSKASHCRLPPHGGSVRSSVSDKQTFGFCCARCCLPPLDLKYRKKKGEKQIHKRGADSRFYVSVVNWLSKVGAPDRYRQQNTHFHSNAE